MIFSNRTLNNIVNFSSSYLLMETLKSQEVVDEFILFTFGKDKKEIMASVGETLMSLKGTEVNSDLDVTRTFLASKLKEFVKLKQIKNDLEKELEILLDDNVTSISYIQRTYSVGYKRATKIFDLYSSLM